MPASTLSARHSNFLCDGFLCVCCTLFFRTHPERNWATDRAHRAVFGQQPPNWYAQISAGWTKQTVCTATPAIVFTSAWASVVCMCWCAGPIPTEIGNMTALSFLALGVNKLTGSCTNTLPNFVRVKTCRRFFPVTLTCCLPLSGRNLVVVLVSGCTCV